MDHLPRGESVTRHLTVLVPAAGNSQRYLDLGIRQPKPLIKFEHGGGFRVTMLEHALQGAQYDWPVVVGVKSGMVRAFQHSLRTDWPYVTSQQTTVVAINQSRGQSDTILQMLAHVPDGEVLVVNSDQGFSPPVLGRLVTEARWAQLTRRHMKAAVLTMKANDPAYSYIDTDTGPWFDEAVEKKVISHRACAGAFWFQDARELAAAISKQQVMDWSGRETYLSEAINRLPPGGRLAVDMYPCEQLYQWGTPKDLALDPLITELDPDIQATLTRNFPR